jgi:hypothetical protein
MHLSVGSFPPGTPQAHLALQVEKEDRRRHCGGLWVCECEGEGKRRLSNHDARGGVDREVVVSCWRELRWRCQISVAPARERR